ncbi:MAG: hypothetical protein QOE46_799 [Acidobacteriota bacterium]|jgi:hypothetical protein|nr:hypothetical protein [Acidobacteriota bacterium]
MRYTCTTLILCLFLSAVSPATAQQQDKNVRVRFARGTTTRTYRGSISHSSDTYIVRARRGQTMSIAVTSPQNRARFNIITRESSGESGDAVEVATEQRQWSQKLSAGGDYYLTVVAERSVSDYTLTISVNQTTLH